MRTVNSIGAAYDLGWATATVLGTPVIPYDVDDIPAFERELAAAIAHLATAVTVEAAIPDAYRYAVTLAEAFAAETSSRADTVSAEEFATRLEVAAARGDLPPEGPRQALYLLARVLKDADDVRLMRLVHNWSARPVDAEGAGWRLPPLSTT